MSFARAIIPLTGVAIWVALLAAAAQGVGTSERDYWFSPLDRPAAQSLVAALDSPMTRAWSPSSMAARGSIAIASGRRSAPRDLAAAATALALGLMGGWLLALGVPRFPVVLVMLAMAAGSTFWWRGVYWTTDTLAPALAVGAAWAATAWLATRRDLFLAVSVVTGSLAVVDDPSWLACLPAIANFLYPRATEPRDRTRGLAALMVIFVVAAVALFSREWPPIMRVDAWPTSALANGLAQEFTPLGLILVVVGIAVSWKAAADTPAMGLLVAGVAGWQWMRPHGSIEPIIMPVTICGWAFVAAALWWVRETLSPRAGATLVAMLGIVLIAGPGLTRVRLSALGKDDLSEDLARTAYNFKMSDLPAGSALVAESRRVDSIVRLAAERSGTPAVIMPQDPAGLQAAIHDGRRVFAFPQARRNLAPLGFLFERAFAGNIAMAAVAGQADCITLQQGRWTDVSMPLSRGSFIIHGATLNSAPGGVTLRLSHPGPIGATSIEPRSIKYELSDSPNEHLATLRIAETGRRSPVTFVFEHAPWSAEATLDGATPARICPGISNAELIIGSRPDAAAQLKMTANAEFGPGWHSPEADPDPFRWTSADRASIRVSVGPPGAIHVTVTATPAAPSARQPQIQLTVNSCALPARPLTPGQGDYQWDVEATCWRGGMNQLWLSVTPLVSPQMLSGSHDTRMLGARIGAIRFARIPRT
jgi:hypothetical protein